MKRAAPAETHFLERDEVRGAARATCPTHGRLALRDRALLLFLYNTGARVQEVADLRVGHLDLGEAPAGPPPRQGRQVADLPALAPDRQTARRAARRRRSHRRRPTAPVFCSATGQAAHPLRHLQDRATPRRPPRRRRAPTARSARTSSGTPRPSTCSRPASRSTSSAAGSATPTSPPPTATPRSTPERRSRHSATPNRPAASAGPRTHPVWRTDETLLNWLSSL